VPRIEFLTTIQAPVTRVFDLCRSVDVHMASAAATGERAIGGVTSGLMQLGDEVTWSARHFGCRWRLTSRILAFDRPRHFRDSMVRGVFRRFDHDHWFEQRGQTTVVRDVFDYTSPGGLLGRIADRLLVERHMRDFLQHRMAVIRDVAESERWQQFVADEPAPTGSGGVPAIEGAEAVVEWWGGWTRCHDFHLLTVPAPGADRGELRIHGWVTDPVPDDRGYFVRSKHCLLRISLTGIRSVVLSSAEVPAILFDLTLQPTADGFLVTWESTLGCEGKIVAAHASITLEPGRPPDGGR
jgi:ligand-binding SRPBCC domain-containing protein